MIPRSVRQQARLKEAQAAPLQAKFLPAPTGGLNSQDLLAEMPPTDCLLFENLWPATNNIRYRSCCNLLFTCSGMVETLMAYNALNGTNLLFAAANFAGVGSIYRVDNLAGGAVGAALVGGSGNTVQALTSGRFDWTQFGTGALAVLVATDLTGSRLPMIYDGTSWTTADVSGGTYAWSGGPSGGNHLLTQVVRYKSRLWMLQGGTNNVYYLPQNVVAGALTLLALGPLFTLGGSIAAMIAVSIDNAAGINDFMAFISTQGEVVMMQGYDPASVSTWSEAGHFFMAKPLALGRRTWVKMGSDALILCTDGVVPLSAELLTDRLQPGVARTAKVRTIFNNLVITQTGLNAGFVFGYQLIYWPEQTALLAQMSQTGVEGADGCPQLVQNTQNNSWARWNYLINLATTDNWGAICWELMGGAAFFGYNGGGSYLKSVVTAGSGTDGVASGNLVPSYVLQTAYQLLDAPERVKIMSGALLHQYEWGISTTGAFSFKAAFVFDYAPNPAINLLPYGYTSPSSVSAATQVLRVNIPVRGRAVSFIWYFAPSSENFGVNIGQLFGITLLYTPGTMLYA